MNYPNLTKTNKYFQDFILENTEKQDDDTEQAAATTSDPHSLFFLSFQYEIPPSTISIQNFDQALTFSMLRLQRKKHYLMLVICAR
jgi:hypothetical protein